VKKFMNTMTAILVVASIVVLRPVNRTQAIMVSSAAVTPVSAACTFPTQMASTPEQTAWQLFVAATCPAGTQYPYVVWENWKEQDQIYQPSTTVITTQNSISRFHVSPLAKKLAQGQLLPNVANQNCNSQTWTGRTICEEARLNPDSEAYVVSNGLTTLAGQQKFVNAGSTFEFTPPSIEIKADWIQLGSCALTPPAGVHVEDIGGTCYALAGIHVISKLIDKWVWATFEPQNSVTNPRRCQVLGCTDNWGSTPTTSSGANTDLTLALAALMKEANLTPEWSNYRLDGVQIDFVDSKNNPTLLGNSIIEGENAGDPSIMTSSSCISCHALSAINGKGQQLSPDFVIGEPDPLPPGGYVRRDFVWSLFCVVKGNC
jgi:hypothetical protein